MSRLFWQWRYARLALRGSYKFTALEAWQEAAASWETNQGERGINPMPTPAIAYCDDYLEWSAR